jgi:hypothetical protein
MEVKLIKLILKYILNDDNVDQFTLNLEKMILR